MIILVLNSGSSSIKFSLFDASGGSENEEPRSLYEGAVDGIGSGGQGKFSIKDAGGNKIVEEAPASPDAEAAFKLVADALSKPPFPYPDAIGHRMVSGGPTLTSHQRVTPAVLDEMDRHVAFAPLHIPIATFIVRKAEELFPNLPNFVCFDSAFHTTIPEVAARFAIPEKYWDQGVRRYGAHGLSYESIVYQLRDQLPSRMIVAHLGNGSSITAMRDGKSVDTSMGLTPTGGIISGTRTGDIDPGVLIYMLRDLASSAPATKDAADQVEAVIAKQSGLLGVSQLSNDMRSLREAIAQGNALASIAVAQFVYVIRKFIGSYVAVLGGLDALVFTGGIGENDVQSRLEICEGLGHLGIALDPERNKTKGELNIGGNNSAVQIRVLPAEEDLLIAMHTFRLMRQS
ncbi:MAG TPA: acetate/propionate family kinase [Acidisarcina sp.]